MSRRKGWVTDVVTTVGAATVLGCLRKSGPAGPSKNRGQASIHIIGVIRVNHLILRTNIRVRPVRIRPLKPWDWLRVGIRNDNDGLRGLMMDWFGEGDPFRISTPDDGNIDRVGCVNDSALLPLARAKSLTRTDRARN